MQNAQSAILALSVSPKNVLTFRTKDDFTAIFKKTEAKIFSHSKYQKALANLLRHQDHSKYRGLIDFLFCECFPVWKETCFEFYQGTSKRLGKESGINRAVLESYDLVLSEVILEAALTYQGEISFEEFKKITDITGAIELQQKAQA